jgi:putative ABC transport system permease protein
VLLSTTGGVLGLIAGWLTVRIAVGFFPAVPASPPTWAVAGALAISVGVGTLFGALPARRATRLDPVAALAGR